MTECTPHQDSVTAAPVASIHATAWRSPRCIRAHTAPPAPTVARHPAGYLEWTTVRAMASVLVVEDDQFVRSALIRHLTEASHTVRSVGTALEALREVAHHRFDVVILDLGLPDLDGSEALKMLRGITDVPVIIATARDDEAEIVRLLNDGADDYLTKPFSVEHLSARMAAVLRRARAAAGAEPPRACCASAVSPSTRCAARPSWTGRYWTSPGASSTCWPSSPGGPEWSWPGANCSPRSGSSRTGTTRPSTSTCPGCAASSARRPPGRATCTRCGGRGEAGAAAVMPR